MYRENALHSLILTRERMIPDQIVSYYNISYSEILIASSSTPNSDPARLCFNAPNVIASHLVPITHLLPRSFYLRVLSIVTLCLLGPSIKTVVYCARLHAEYVSGDVSWLRWWIWPIDRVMFFCLYPTGLYMLS